MGRIRLGIDDEGHWYECANDMFAPWVELPDDMISEFREISRRYRSMEDYLDTHATPQRLAFYEEKRRRGDADK